MTAAVYHATSVHDWIYSLTPDSRRRAARLAALVPTLKPNTELFETVFPLRHCRRTGAQQPLDLKISLAVGER